MNKHLVFGIIGGFVMLLICILFSMDYRQMLIGFIVGSLIVIFIEPEK